MCFCTGVQPVPPYSTGQCHAIQPELGRFRRLIGIGDARELGDLTRPDLLVQTLGITRLADLEGGVDVDLHEVVRANDFPRVLAVLDVGADERSDGDDTCAVHEPGHLGDAPDVFGAVIGAEAEIAVQAMAHVVAVEHDAEASGGRELAFDLVGDGGFSAAAEAGEPDRVTLLAEHGFTVLTKDRAAGLGDVLAFGADGFLADNAVEDHACAHRDVGQTVDDDEGTGGAVAVVGVEGNGPVQGDMGAAEFVELQGVGVAGLLAQVVDVHLVAQFG